MTPTISCSRFRRLISDCFRRAAHGSKRTERRETAASHCRAYRAYAECILDEVGSDQMCEARRELIRQLTKLIH
jgi:hypothetical protein